MSFSEAGGQLSKENDFLKFTHQDIPHSNSNQGRIIQNFPEEGANPKGKESKYINGPKFPENCMKMKKIRLGATKICYMSSSAN